MVIHKKNLIYVAFQEPQLSRVGWWLYHPLLKSTVDRLLKVSYLSSKWRHKLFHDEPKKLEDTFGNQNSPEKSCKCFWDTYLFQRGFLCPAVMMVGVNSSKNNLKRGVIINHVCVCLYETILHMHKQTHLFGKIPLPQHRFERKTMLRWIPLL